MPKPLKIIIVAGEHSGDLLGAGLIAALKQRVPDIQISGIAGPRMVQAGCSAWHSLESIMMMGFIEPLKKLPALFKLRRSLVQRIIQEKPDVFIGIDSPDFNLGLELSLKEKGIRTVHYVSPSVWAWRKNRIFKIKKAVDLMLTLLPFESEIYQQHGIPFVYVGHPLADSIPLYPDPLAARKKLGLSLTDPILALLPGSRRMVLNHLAPVFIQTAQRCLEKQPNLKIVAAMVDESSANRLQQILAKVAPHCPLSMVVGKTSLVLEAASVVLLASGTATLETMLYKKPMVVAYRMAMMNYYLARWLIDLPYFSLPNLIAGKHVVPEFLQKAVTAENLSQAVLGYLDFPNQVKQLEEEFMKLHHLLKQDANQKAAEAILQLIQ